MVTIMNLIQVSSAEPFGLNSNDDAPHSITLTFYLTHTHTDKDMYTYENCSSAKPGAHMVTASQVEGK